MKNTENFFERHLENLKDLSNFRDIKSKKIY